MNRTNFPHFFLPRIEYMVLIAVFAGIVASGPRMLNFDGDLPRHILTGSLILQTGRIHTTDIFSFRTTGYPSYPHEWFAQVLFALAYRVLDLDGVVVLTALVILFTWTIVFRTAIKRAENLLSTLLITVLGVAASQIHVLPRPHIFTYVLLAIWLRILENSSKNGARGWWLLPMVMLLWVNIHGMFVLGIIVLGIYLAGDFLESPSKAWFYQPHIRRLLQGGALSILATFLSPSGPEIWRAIIALGSNIYITSVISEYQSANFHQPETWPFLLLMTITTIGLARSTGRLFWKDVLLVCAFTGLAIYSSRMIPLYAIVVTPITSALAASWSQNVSQENKLRAIENNLFKLNVQAGGKIWIAVIVLLVVVLLRSGVPLDPGGQGNRFDGRYFPVEAVSWLEEHPQHSRMFNEFDWGGYLLLRLWPEYQIFMDGHTHIYGESLTREYQRVATLSAGWEEILTNYEIGWIIMRRDAQLVLELSGDADWAIGYEDETTAILIRK